MSSLIGRKLFVVRGKISTIMVVTDVENITDEIFSVTGHDEKRKMTFTMDINEIHNNIVGGDL